MAIKLETETHFAFLEVNVLFLDQIHFVETFVNVGVNLCLFFVEELHKERNSDEDITISIEDSRIVGTRVEGEEGLNVFGGLLGLSFEEVGERIRFSGFSGEDRGL